MSLVPLVLAVALSGAPAASSELAVGLRPVGLDSAGVKAVKARLGTELGAAGVGFRVLSVPLAAGCLESEACVAAKARGSAALLDVGLVRVGPLVQVTVRLYASDGTLKRTAEDTADADGFPGAGALLAPELLAAIHEQVPKAAPAAETSPVAAGGVATTETEVIDVSPGEEPKGPEKLSLLGYGGVGVAAVGGLLALGGAGLAFHEAGVLEDAASLGTDKGRARVLGPVALGVVGAGVLVLGAGGAMSSIGFAME